MKNFRLDWLVLPLIGIVAVMLLWQVSSATWAKELPSPARTWAASKDYILKPFEKRGEMDQGILRFTWYSLVLVAKGYAVALIIGMPIGFCFCISRTFIRIIDPIFLILMTVLSLSCITKSLGLLLCGFN